MMLEHVGTERLLARARPPLHAVLLELIREAGRDGITEGAMADAFGRAAPHPERMRTVLAKLALDGAAHRDEQHWKLGRPDPAADRKPEPVQQALPSREARKLIDAKVKRARVSKRYPLPVPPAITAADGTLLFRCIRCDDAKPRDCYQSTVTGGRSPTCRTCRTCRSAAMTIAQRARAERERMERAQELRRTSGGGRLSLDDFADDEPRSAAVRPSPEAVATRIRRQTDRAMSATASRLTARTTREDNRR